MKSSRNCGKRGTEHGIPEHQRDWALSLSLSLPLSLSPSLSLPLSFSLSLQFPRSLFFFLLLRFSEEAFLHRLDPVCLSSFFASLCSLIVAAKTFGRNCLSVRSHLSRVLSFLAHSLSQPLFVYKQMFSLSCCLA